MILLLDHPKSPNNIRHRQNHLISVLINTSTISALSIIPSYLLILDWLLL